jgi:hypothetical protein
MSPLILSGLLWAFSFWLVADALRRQSNPLWIVLILLAQPYGGLVYLAYSRWQVYRGAQARLPRAAAPARAASPLPDGGAEPLFDFADGLEEQAQFGEAASLYRSALEQGPGEPRGLHGLARCLMELGQKREALEAYEALMVADPRYRNYAAALEYAEALHRAGRDLDAAELLEGMVGETGRPNHRLALAHYCEAAGQRSRAQRVLSDALAAFASSPANEQALNRRWQRRIADKLQELAPLGE